MRSHLNALERGARQGRERREELLDNTVARLQEELKSRQQQLAAEQSKNVHAKAQVGALEALSLAQEALGLLLIDAGHCKSAASAVSSIASGSGATAASSGSGAASGPESGPSSILSGDSGASGGGVQAVLDKLEERLQMLIVGAFGARRATAPRPEDSTGSSAESGTVRSDPAPPPVQILGTHSPPAGEFLRSIVAAKGVNGSQEEFRAWWKERVMSLAMVLHQWRNGRADLATLEKAVYEMGVRFGGIFMHETWAIDIMVLNVETGQPAGEAPQELWDRCAAAMKLTYEQSLMYLNVDRWWKAVTQAHQSERQALAQRALENPTDLELQEEVARGLERVNWAYRASIIASMTVCMYGIMSPEQPAESWVNAWPRMPLMTAIFAALNKQFDMLYA